MKDLTLKKTLTSDSKQEIISEVKCVSGWKDSGDSERLEESSSKERRAVICFFMCVCVCVYSAAPDRAEERRRLLVLLHVMSLCLCRCCQSFQQSIGSSVLFNFFFFFFFTVGCCCCSFTPELQALVCCIVYVCVFCILSLVVLTTPAAQHPG